MPCSSEFALRPYLYLLLHWPFAKVAALASSLGGPRFVAFYFVRIVLALLDAVLDIRLVRRADLDAHQDSNSNWQRVNGWKCLQRCLQLFSQRHAHMTMYCWLNVLAMLLATVRTASCAQG